MAWDTERTERLLALHREGKTAGEIGAELGVTRNAVIGKLHRMGMAKKRMAAAQQEPEPVAEPQSDGIIDKPDVNDVATEEPPIQSTEAEVEDDRDRIEAHRQSAKTAEEKSLRLSLMELTSRTCKWPIGDPATDDFWFCGLPSQPGKPYCEAHNNLACQPLTSRRDRKLARKSQMRALRS